MVWIIRIKTRRKKKKQDYTIRLCTAVMEVLVLKSEKWIDGPG
jgi:hypothetical protein